VPRSLDYFIATGKYADKFIQAYNKSNTIQLIFFSDNYLDSCSEYFEIRGEDGRLYASGDGKDWLVWSRKSKEYIVWEGEKEKLEKEFAMPAKPVLRLRFILPKVAGVFGVWEFTTHGVESSIPNIRDAFDTVQNLAGSVVNIAFDLHVEKVKSNKPESKSVFPVVSLIANICKENMEALAEYYEQGKKLRGLIDDARVKQLMEYSTVPEEKPVSFIVVNSEETPDEYVPLADIQALAASLNTDTATIADRVSDEFGLAVNEIPISAKELIFSSIKTKYQ